MINIKFYYCKNLATLYRLLSEGFCYLLVSNKSKLVLVLAVFVCVGFISIKVFRMKQGLLAIKYLVPNGKTVSGRWILVPNLINPKFYYCKNLATFYRLLSEGFCSVVLEMVYLSHSLLLLHTLLCFLE